MATLQSLAFSTHISLSSRHRSLAGHASGAINCPSSQFNDQPLFVSHSQYAATQRQKCKARRLTIMMVKPTIQFIQGTNEQTVPDVKLTKSVFDSSGEVGDITGLYMIDDEGAGLYMIDDEGVLQSVDVSAKFVNGKPSTSCGLLSG